MCISLFHPPFILILPLKLLILTTYPEINQQWKWWAHKEAVTVNILLGSKSSLNLDQWWKHTNPLKYCAPLHVWGTWSVLGSLRSVGNGFIALQLSDSCGRSESFTRRKKTLNTSLLISCYWGFTLGLWKILSCKLMMFQIWFKWTDCYILRNKNSLNLKL